MKIIFYRNPHYIFSVGLLFLLTGCSQVPVYTAPDASIDRARLKLEFTDESLLAGSVRVVHTSRLAVCRESLPNPERLFIRSNGNPLISNLNKDGVWIPAGKTFSISVRSVVDARVPCDVNASFNPQPSGSYILKIFHENKLNTEACTVNVIDENSGTRAAPEFRQITCH